MKLNGILSVLFPHKCTFCRKGIDYNNDKYICDACITTLPYADGKLCLKCSRPLEADAMPICFNCRRYKYSFHSAFTPLIYTGNVRKAIVNMKFHNRESYCRSFAYLIVNRIFEKGFINFDFITYIPLSKERLQERKFNQSETVAEKCAEILHLPVIPTLFRKDGTKQQSTLNLKERRKNVRNAFLPLEQTLSGTALLIDDVYTTGSTADYCSSLLLKMGCEKVYIASVALRDFKKFEN